MVQRKKATRRVLFWLSVEKRTLQYFDHFALVRSKVIGAWNWRTRTNRLESNSECILISRSIFPTLITRSHEKTCSLLEHRTAHWLRAVVLDAHVADWIIQETAVGFKSVRAINPTLTTLKWYSNWGVVHQQLTQGYGGGEITRVWWGRDHKGMVGRDLSRAISFSTPVF